MLQQRKNRIVKDVWLVWQFICPNPECLQTIEIADEINIHTTIVKCSNCNNVWAVKISNNCTKEEIKNKIA